MNIHLYPPHNKEKIQRAADAVLQVLQPGDVINQVNRFPWWAFHYNLAVKAIRIHQRRLFGRKSFYKDDHNMLFFDENSILSVEPPRAILKPLTHFSMTRISIYRLRIHRLDDEDIAFMRNTALQLVGEEYDVGQLLDRVVNRLLGYEWQQRIRIFDFGKKKMVCSVGVRAVFEHLYQKQLRKEKPDQELWLFSEMNPDRWPVRKRKRFQGTDIDATTPAHFANSEYFQHEFELIARFDKGKRIFP